MITRELQEKKEYETLSELAVRSAETRGRERAEEPCPLRTEFQRDRDRIIHCKSMKRLMHKTQVFLSPEGDHFSTRLTHTLAVAQISRTVARGLALNEDLTEAIALGHDLGHTPFGHNGEEYLNERHPDGFRHTEQSLRVVDILEEGCDGKGLNLTVEVRDGIRHHSGKGMPFTLEGRIVRICDRIAYINHDIDDAIRAGIITWKDLPSACIRHLGKNRDERINRLVTDLIISSEKAGDIVQSEECGFYMDRLRDYMFERVYRNEEVKKTSEMFKIRNLIFSLYDYYVEHPHEMPAEQIEMLYIYGTEEVVKDYIAGMTDRYAIKTYKKIFLPTGWRLSDTLR